MRVLVLNYEYPPIGGGGSILTERLVSGFAENKDEVTVVTSAFTGFPFREHKKGITIYRMPVLRKDRHQARMLEMFLYVFFSFFFLLWLRLHKKFDTINIHFAIPTGVLIWPAKILFNAPITLVIHGADVPNKERPKYERYYPFLKGVISKVINASNNIIAVNYEVCRQIIPLTRKKVHVIPNGVETSRFRPLKTKKEYDVIFIGRFIPMKDPLLAIEAFEKLSEKVASAKMLMLGDGPLFSEANELAKKKGLENNITFLKWVDNKQMPEIINECKICWSVQLMNNYGSVALLEAMACGLPVVLSDVGESKLLINGNGCLAKRIPAEISKKTLEMLSKKSLDDMGKKSREIAVRFSKEEMVNRYRRLLSRRY